MALLDVFQAIAPRSLRRIALMAIIAALANALVLALINMASSAMEKQDRGLIIAILFAGTIIIFMYSQRYMMIEATKETETLIHGLRQRLIDAIGRSELIDIDRIGRTRIFSGISKDIQTLTQSSVLLAIAFQNAILILFISIYLMATSMTAFLIAASFILTGVLLYLARTRQVNGALQKAALAERGLDDLVNGALAGFKETKLNERRGAEVAEDLVAASRHAADERVVAGQGFARNFIFAQNFLFLLLGTMVFVVPALSGVDADESSLTTTTTIVLFMIGPLGGLVGAVPVLTNANAAAAGIQELERLLVAKSAVAGAASAEASGPPRNHSFREIALRGVAFRYETEPGQYAFEVGPFNLTLRAGETLFISGGNGSGKSTLLRLLTALYPPSEGVIVVDGTPVTSATVSAYRALFSTVLSDYHLFPRFYGLEPGFEKEAQELLYLFEMESKTIITSAGFSSVDLSAGQRKRLALIVAMLERRPICVLDEWAADQDPEFRRKFYDEILPVLKRRDVTVIAVTHDDRYYDRADRLLHMEDGKIVTRAGEFADA